MGISLFSTRLILNALGATDFGIFSLVSSMIAMLTFLNNSMTQATQRFLNIKLGSGDEVSVFQVFNASVFLHLIIGVVVVIIIEAAGLYAFNSFLNIPYERLFAAKMVFHFAVISTFFSIISVPYDAIINANEHMLFDSVVGIVQALCILAIAISIMHFGADKLIFYGALTALLMFFVLVVKRVYCRLQYQESKVEFKKYLFKKTVFEMLHYAKFTFISAVSSMIGFYGIPIIINSFFLPQVNAAYGISGQINGQISVFSSTMMRALNPQVTKSEGANNRQRMINLTFIGSKFGVLLLAVFAIPFIIEAPYILTIWLKNPPQYSVIFCQSILVVSLISQLSLPLLNSINAVGKIKEISILSSIVYISVIPLLIMIYYFNGKPYYLYFLLIGSELILLTLRLYFSIKLANLRIKMFLSNVIRPLLIVLLLVLIFTIPVIFIMENGVIRLFIVLSISTLTFFITTFFCALSKEEKLGVIMLIDKVKTKISFISTS